MAHWKVKKNGKQVDLHCKFGEEVESDYCGQIGEESGHQDTRLALIFPDGERIVFESDQLIRVDD